MNSFKMFFMKKIYLLLCIPLLFLSGSCSSNDDTSLPENNVSGGLPEFFSFRSIQGGDFTKFSWNPSAEEFSEFDIIDASGLSVNSFSYFNDTSLGYYNFTQNSYWINDFDSNTGEVIPISSASPGEFLIFQGHNDRDIIRAFEASSNETLSISFTSRSTGVTSILETTINDFGSFGFTALNNDYFIVQATNHITDGLLFLIFDVNTQTLLGTIDIPFEDAVDALGNIYIAGDNFYVSSSLSTSLSIYKMDISTMSASQLTDAFSGAAFTIDGAVARYHFVASGDLHFGTIDLNTGTITSTNIQGALDTYVADNNLSFLSYINTTYSNDENAWVFQISASASTDAADAFIRFLKIELDGTISGVIEGPDDLLTGTTLLFVD